jgi:hypothetical protein
LARSNCASRTLRVLGEFVPGPPEERRAQQRRLVEAEEIPLVGDEVVVQQGDGGLPAQALDVQRPAGIRRG